MSRTILTLAAFLLLPASHAWASAIDDARTCFEGTRQAAAGYIPYCTRAIESGALGLGDLAMTYNNRGAILQILGREDEALTDFNQALSLNPALLLSYLNRGVILTKRQEIQLALNDFNNVIALAPRDTRGYVNRSHVYIKQQQYEKALEDLDRALLLNPEDPMVYNNFAIVRFNTGQMDLALAASESAIAQCRDAAAVRVLGRERHRLFARLRRVDAGGASFQHPGIGRQIRRHSRQVPQGPPARPRRVGARAHLPAPGETLFRARRPGLSRLADLRRRHRHVHLQRPPLARDLPRHGTARRRTCDARL